jgi:hypothetical protein
MPSLHLTCAEVDVPLHKSVLFSGSHASFSDPRVFGSAVVRRYDWRPYRANV